MTRPPVSLAHAILQAGDERLALCAALICWAEAIRRNHATKEDSNAVPCTLPK